MIKVKSVQSRARAGFYPNKLMGQHFLESPETALKIVKAANLSPEKTILEIGPGLGALTFELAARSKRVIAVEKDKNLFALVQQNLETKNIKNVGLVCGDILKVPLTELGLPNKYSVVANIPYYLTSRLIRALLENKNLPQEIFLTVQKEVAERIIAEPPRMNLLALGVQAYGEPKIIFPIPRRVFHPVPKVDSAFIVIANISKTKLGLDAEREKLFFKIARAAFGQRRKTLLNSLASNMAVPKTEVQRILKSAEIDPGQRAENLAPEDWTKIAKLWPE